MQHHRGYKAGKEKSVKQIPHENDLEDKFININGSCVIFFLDKCHNLGKTEIHNTSYFGYVDTWKRVLATFPLGIPI